MFIECEILETLFHKIGYVDFNQILMNINHSSHRINHAKREEATKTKLNRHY